MRYTVARRNMRTLCNPGQGAGRQYARQVAAAGQHDGGEAAEQSVKMVDMLMAGSWVAGSWVASFKQCFFSSNSVLQTSRELRS